MRTSILLLLLSLLAACGGQPVRPGESTGEQIVAAWGPPTVRYPEADGGERLLYSSGPMGFTTQVVVTGADGKVRSLHNALTEAEFAKVRAGEDTREDIQRRFGPPAWTQYFGARNELVWEWRYCDVWTYPARFNVLFDAATGIVRSTMAVREDMGRWRHGFCTQ